MTPFSFDLSTYPVEAPHNEGAVAAGADDVAPVGGPADVGERGGVAEERLEVERLRAAEAVVPDLDKAVLSAGDDVGAVGAHLEKRLNEKMRLK